MELVNFKMKLGDKLRQRRGVLGISQKQAAEMVGTYQQRYQHWESGHTRPDPDEIGRLSDAFGVSADWLLNRESTVKPYPTEVDKEIFLLCEEAKQYGSEGVKRLRKMLPLIFDKKKKK